MASVETEVGEEKEDHEPCVQAARGGPILLWISGMLGHWAGFYAGPRGAGQPLRMAAFVSKQLVRATAWQVMSWGVFSLPQGSLCMSCC